VKVEGQWWMEGEEERMTRLKAESKNHEATDPPL